MEVETFEEQNTLGNLGGQDKVNQGNDVVWDSPKDRSCHDALYGHP